MSSDASERGVTVRELSRNTAIAPKKDLNRETGIAMRCVSLNYFLNRSSAHCGRQYAHLSNNLNLPHLCCKSHFHPKVVLGSVASRWNGFGVRVRGAWRVARGVCVCVCVCVCMVPSSFWVRARLYLARSSNCFSLSFFFFFSFLFVFFFFFFLLFFSLKAGCEEGSIRMSRQRHYL